MIFNSLPCLPGRGTTFLPTLIFLLLILHLNSVICILEGNICDNSSTISNVSIYSKNLNLVISDLLRNAPQSLGFNTSFRGQSPNKVYGLLQCTGNISAERCSKCAVEANNSIHGLCPNNIGGRIWFDDCFLRYHNTNFISKLDVGGFNLRERFVISSSSSTTDAFKKTTTGLLSNLSNKVSIPANKGFATGSAKYNATGILYGFVQCFRDVSIKDCSTCLAKARANLLSCCSQYPAARFVCASCRTRYDINPEFYASAIPPPFPPPPFPSPGESIHPTISTSGKKSSKTLGLVLGLGGGIILVLFIFLIIFRKRITSAFFKRPITITTPTPELHEASSKSGFIRVKNVVFSLGDLIEATDNFHESNKLGNGGFGAVYKGITRDGNEIAVKKLSAQSKQGKKEFMNEVDVVGNVKHRNLAKLLGCCVERNERLLVYEYFPNKSLDTFLFDSEKRKELDWPKRYNFIIGIARGLVYLHQESQLRIIHRDIKANNILLDHKLDPKIADFGLAKLFPEDKTHIHTRVAGTYGYMPPEYAMRGQLSVKVDVYSFGVLLLEIISGRKNNDNHLPHDMQHLVEWAWKLFEEGNALKMVDSEASEVSEEEALRCIHVGLLCVQENATLRPFMSDVITMLSSTSVTLSNPSKPAFVSTGERHELKPEPESMSSLGHDDQSSSGAPTSAAPEIRSVNEASITEVESR